MRETDSYFYADSKIKFSLDLCIELYLQLVLDLVSSRYGEISPSTKCAENGQFDSALLMLCAVLVRWRWWCSQWRLCAEHSPRLARVVLESLADRAANQPSRSLHNHGESAYLKIMRQFDQTRFLKPSIGYNLSIDNPISSLLSTFKLFRLMS